MLNRSILLCFSFRTIRSDTQMRWPNPCYDFLVVCTGHYWLFCCQRLTKPPKYLIIAAITPLIKCSPSIYSYVQFSSLHSKTAMTHIFILHWTLYFDISLTRHTTIRTASYIYEFPYVLLYWLKHKIDVDGVWSFM